MKTRSRRTGLAALLISVALHGLGFWWVSSRPPQPLALTVELAAGQLVFVEVPPPPPPPPPAPPEPPRPTPVRTPPATRPIAVAAPSQPETEVEPEGPTSDLPVAEDVPRLAPSLSPTLAASSFLVSEDAGTVEASVVVRAGLHALERPADLVADIARETVGRGKVDRGLVHSYYGQLGKALLKTWDADRAVSKAGLKGFGEQFVENSKTYNEIWLDRAAAYGASGSPLQGADPVNTRRAPTNDRVGGIPGVDLESRKELSRQMREAYKQTRRAVIRVVQDPTGKLVRVELLQPSNDGNVDREALKDVQAVAQRLPPPPPEVAKDARELVSVWSFELVISISPPVPTFTFEFDEALGFIDARLPLDRRIYKKVRLVSVE